CFFPDRVLNNLSAGITTILAWSNSDELINLIQKYQVTQICSPPSVYFKLIGSTNRPLPQLQSVRRVITTAAPAPKSLVQKMIATFENAENQIVYGTTDVNPISLVDMKDTMDSGSAGYLVGRPVPGLRLNIINPLAERCYDPMTPH